MPDLAIKARLLWRIPLFLLMPMLDRDWSSLGWIAIALIVKLINANTLFSASYLYYDQLLLHLHEWFLWPIILGKSIFAFIRIPPVAINGLSNCLCLSHRIFIRLNSLFMLLRLFHDHNQLANELWKFLVL